MAAVRGEAILAAMDRSLNADDFRFLEALGRGRSARPSDAPPELEELPGWFQRLVRQQCIQFGIELPGPPVVEERAA